MSGSYSLNVVDASAPPRSELWLVTDAAGEILDLSAAAARLLNLSVRGARGRKLPTFLPEDRPRLLRELLHAADGAIVQRSTVLQPRDRRARRIRFDIAAEPQTPGARERLLWMLVLEDDR